MNPSRNCRAVHKHTRPRKGDWGLNPSQNCRAVHLSVQDQGKWDWGSNPSQDYRRNRAVHKCTRPKKGKGTGGRILPKTAGKYTSAQDQEGWGPGVKSFPTLQGTTQEYKTKRRGLGVESFPRLQGSTHNGRGLGVESFLRLQGSVHKCTRPRERDSSQQDRELGKVCSQQRGERNGPFTTWREG